MKIKHTHTQEVLTMHFTTLSANLQSIVDSHNDKLVHCDVEEWFEQAQAILDGLEDSITEDEYSQMELELGF